MSDRLSVGIDATLEWLREGDGRRDDKFEGHLIPFLSLAVTPFDGTDEIDLGPTRIDRVTRVAAPGAGLGDDGFLRR